MAKRRRAKQREEFLSPYPHGHKKPGKYVLYIDWPEKDRSCVFIYAEAFGAKRHLDLLLQGLEYKIIKDDELMGLIDSRAWLVAENGIRIRCTLLSQVLAHKDSEEESSWEMEARHVREIEAFRYGQAITKNPSIDQEEKKERKAKRRQQERITKTRTPRQIPDGMVTVAMIAESLSIVPREARARLRKAGVPKPDLGWMWSTDDAPAIKELIANG